MKIQLLLPMIATTLFVALPTLASTDWLEPNPVEDQQSVRNLAIQAFSDWSPHEKQPGVSPSMIWPIKDPNPVLLQRYGTPTLVEINANGTLMKVVDSHEALDITRSDAGVSDDVVAPLDGIAVVVSQGETYTTGIAILDRKSGLAVTLLHVVPHAGLSNSPMEVKQGTVIGKLAPVSTMASGEKYKHTHLMVTDLVSSQLLNPLSFYRAIYTDRLAPVLESATAKRVDDTIQLRLTTYDNDGRSWLPFEIHSLAFDVTLENGEVLKSTKRCALDQLANHPPNIQLNARGVFDLDAMTIFDIPETGASGEYKSNAANPKKRFIYALDRIKSGMGSCEITQEPLRVLKTVERILLKVSAWDFHGNRSDRVFNLRID